MSGWLMLLLLGLSVSSQLITSQACKCPRDHRGCTLKQDGQVCGRGSECCSRWCRLSSVASGINRRVCASC
ncbi:hypothetical protein BOX15_Mlig024546g1 [Macrostomum lignano]|uniref:Uncharacterized protein n=1 Tax=Macrostomum lignano TaxID=282301 RepID=A0A267GX33_9PLAT|nr:hypothetical protein BOX15_Mlig024546g1 [Macrostomum lignano]